MIADLKFALRMLVKNPAFSIVAFLAIALGIGANATIFGIINALICVRCRSGIRTASCGCTLPIPDSLEHRRSRIQTFWITRSEIRLLPEWPAMHSQRWE